MSTEAMKLALKVLQGVWKGGFSYPPEQHVSKAITALDEALAQPQQEPVATAYFEKITGRIVPPGDTHQRKFPMCYRPLVFGDTSPPAQPQQEPVAWANPNDLQNFDMKVRTNGGPLHTVPLYTSPPARKPLTDEQVSAIWKAVPNQALYEAVMVFARAIESAHGIKGDA